MKADPDSASMNRLETASHAVRKATDNLVKAAQQALDREEETANVSVGSNAVNYVVEVRQFYTSRDSDRCVIRYIFLSQEINHREEVLRMERELEKARGRLEKFRQGRYQTDSETEQSG